MCSALYKALSHLLLQLLQGHWETHNTHDCPDYEQNKSTYRHCQTEQCPPHQLVKELGAGPSMAAGFENVHLTKVGSMTRQLLYLSTTEAPMGYPLSLPPPRTRLWALYPISRHWTIERFILAIATIYLPESEIRRSPSVSLTEDTRVQRRRPQGRRIPGPSQSWYRSSAPDTEYGVPHVCVHMPSTYIWDHGLLIPDSKTRGHQALLICWPTRQSLWSREEERPAFAKQLLSQSLGQAQRTREKKLLIISL